ATEPGDRHRTQHRGKGIGIAVGSGADAKALLDGLAEDADKKGLAEIAPEHSGKAEGEHQAVIAQQGKIATWHNSSIPPGLGPAAEITCRFSAQHECAACWRQH